MTFTDWYNATKDAWLLVWDKFAGFFPKAFGAVLILVVAWLAGYWLKRLIVQLLRASGVQLVLEIAQFDTVLKKAGYTQDSSTAIGNLFMWGMWATGFVAALSVLQLEAFARFFNDIFGYLPIAMEGLGIFFIGLVVAAFIGRLVTGLLTTLNLGWAAIVGGFTQGVIIAFAFFMAFFQLGIPFTLLSTVFTGFVAAAAIGLGLAFGLGAQDTVRNLLSRFSGRK